MISGRIRNREAIVDLEISRPGQPSRQLEAIIDTGYNGYLTLPSPLVTILGLPLAGYRRGMLADGTVTRLAVHLASIVWNGRQKEVLVSQAAGAPLVGMSLLEGNRLTMDVLEDGDVTIETLP